MLGVMLLVLAGRCVILSCVYVAMLRCHNAMQYNRDIKEDRNQFYCYILWLSWPPAGAQSLKEIIQGEYGSGSKLSGKKCVLFY